MTAHYFADTEGLGLGRPDREPLASETIEPIKDLIQALLDNGSAYAVDGDVYFRVRADPDYGSLSHRSVDDMDQGEGVEGSDRKEDPLDFALWKAQKEDEDTAWDAPWGRGRPGWHIECSAMAEEVLGVGFEIHTGGNDLTFPHHENEAAQTRRGARRRALAHLDAQRDAPDGRREDGQERGQHHLAGRRARRARPRRGDHVLRRAATTASRSSSTTTTLAQAAADVRRVREAARRLAPGPVAGRTWRRTRSASSPRWPTTSTRRRRWPRSSSWIREANRREPGTGDADLREMLQILALDNLLDGADADGEPDAAALALLERARPPAPRATSRAADRLRDELAAQGWQVRDSADGPQLVRVDP